MARADRDRGRWRALLGPRGVVVVTLLGVAAVAALVLALHPLRDAVGNAIGGDTHELREELRGLGVTGALITLALCLVHAFVWYPSEIVDTAAGFVYGFWVAIPLVMAGWLANAVVTWWIGRVVARPVLARALGERRFDEAERMVAAGGVTLLLAVRLVPVIPFSLTGYVAGAARVPLWPFLWTTAVGYLPITVIFVYLGSRLDTFSPTDPAILAGAVALVALLFFARWLRTSVATSSADGGDG